MNCIWLTDETVKNICLNKNLGLINLGNTNISSNCTNYLKTLPNLRCLNIGSTRIKGNYTLDLTKDLKLLKKLSLRGLGANDNVSGRGTINTKQMSQIGLNLGYLTHLDISSCQNVDDTIFDNGFSSLKFVNVWMANGITKNQRTSLAKKGIQVIEDMYDR